MAAAVPPGSEYCIGRGTSSCRFRFIDTVAGAYSLLLKFIPESQRPELDKFAFLGQWHTMDERAKWEKVKEREREREGKKTRGGSR